MAIYNKSTKFTRQQLINYKLRRDSIVDVIYSIIRLLGIIVQNIYCVSSYLVLSWILLYPISLLRFDLYSKLENFLYNSLLYIVSSWSLAAGCTIIETGDDYKHLIEQSDEQTSKTITQKTTKNKFRLTNGQLSGDSGLKAENSISNKCERNEDSKESESEYDLKKNFTNSCMTTNVAQITDLASTPNGPNGGLIRANTSVPNCPNTSQQKPRILFLCNHLSTADVPLIMQSFSTLTNQSILWVLDSQFKPTNFGLVCSSHGDFFIAKNSFTDGALRDQVLMHPDRNILVLFPEGGFWRKRLDGSNRYAVRNGLPLTRYVTHPRFGAFKDLIDPSVNVTHIVDATLMYEDIKDPVSIFDIVLGSRKEAAILHYKVYNRNEIEPNEQWLRNIWLEKDKLLQRYYEDRDSAYRELCQSLRCAKLDWIKVIFVHIFYLIVCYLAVYRLFNATSETMIKARDLYYSNISEQIPYTSG